MSDEDFDFLPDDSESLPATEETVEPTEDFETEEVDEPTSEPTEPVQEPETTPQERMLKLKVDRGEREIPESEAIMLAQKGLNYERAVERARVEAAQQARDTLVAELGYTWNGKPILTESEYKQAIAEQQMIDQYKDHNLPDEVIQELVESRRDREERNKEKQRMQEESVKSQGINQFLEFYESVNGKAFDHTKDPIPQEVIDVVQTGVPLKQAYMEHHIKQLQTQLKIAKQNETNVKRSPIRSTTANGSNKNQAVDPFLEGFMS